MAPGETQDFHVRSLDNNGLTVKDIDGERGEVGGVYSADGEGSRHHERGV